MTICNALNPPPCSGLADRLFVETVVFTVEWCHLLFAVCVQSLHLQLHLFCLCCWLQIHYGNIFKVVTTFIALLCRGNICKCEGRFGNTWRGQDCTWPRPALHAGLFLSLVGVRDTGGWKIFTLALRLRSGRVEFLSWGDGSKSQEGTRLWIYTCGRSISVLPDFSRFSGHICNSWVFFHQ